MVFFVVVRYQYIYTVCLYLSSFNQRAVALSQWGHGLSIIVCIEATGKRGGGDDVDEDKGVPDLQIWSLNIANIF